MAKLVFKTPEDHPETVELLGIGVLGPYGEGGVPVEVAAERGMVELVHRGDDGNPVLDDDDNTKPLKGKQLEAAAKEYADGKPIVVASVADSKATVEALAKERGVAADRPPALEVAEEEARRSLGVEPANDDPDEVVEGGPDQGQPSPPPAGTDGGDA